MCTPPKSKSASSSSANYGPAHAVVPFGLLAPVIHPLGWHFGEREDPAFRHVQTESHSAQPYHRDVSCLSRHVHRHNLCQVIHKTEAGRHRLGLAFLMHAGFGHRSVRRPLLCAVQYELCSAVSWRKQTRVGTQARRGRLFGSHVKCFVLVQQVLPERKCCFIFRQLPTICVMNLQMAALFSKRRRKQKSSQSRGIHVGRRLEFAEQVFQITAWLAYQ